MAKEKSRELLAMEEAQRAHKQAKREYDAAVAAADQEVRASQKEHDKQVSNAEKRLEVEKVSLDKSIASIGSAKLYWDHVENGQSSLSLEEAMTVEVNCSGNVYSTVATKGKVGVSMTGAVVGGLIAGPIGMVAAGRKNKIDTKNHVHDRRNLFVTLRTTSNAMTIECDPEKEKQARDFADAIVRTAASMSTVAENHAKKIESLQQEIVIARNNTAAIETAKAKAEAVRNNTDALDSARQTFEQTKEAVSVDELTSYEHGKAVRRNMAIGTVVVLILIVVVCCVLFLH